MFGHVDLLRGVMTLIPLVLSLTVHEWAHAYSAYRLGDDTAARMGRLTLNPIPHIDPIGTILLPLMNVPFGWAKPVPITPTRFRREVSMRAGIMITAVAGPASNLVLALLCTVLAGVLLRFGLVHEAAGLGMLLQIAIQLNVALAVFNLLPIPPLDGSRVVDGFIPYRFRSQWETFTQYSWIALLLVVFFGSSVWGVPLGWLIENLAQLERAIAGF
jgi:Zn-dependent protease